MSELTLLGLNDLLEQVLSSYSYVSLYVCMHICMSVRRKQGDAKEEEEIKDNIWCITSAPGLLTTGNH